MSGLRDAGVKPPAQLLSQWIGLLVFLAVACLFVERRWTGYLMSLVALTGLALLARRRDFDRTDAEFLLIAGVLPAAFLLNMMIHGFGGSILGRPLRLLIGFFAFYAIRRASPAPMLFFDGCAGGAVVAGLVAIYQVVLLDVERASADWNAVPFGNYSMLLGFLVLSALLAGHVRPLARVLWYAAALAMSGTALVLSQTRGTWLAVPVLLVLVAYVRPGIRTRHRLGASAVILAASIGVAASAPGLRDRLEEAADHAQAYLAAPTSMQAQDTPVGLRLAMWRWGLERFAERPFVGIGMVHYADYRRASVEQGELPRQFLGMANVHNQIIQFLAVGGLLMASALLAFWVLAARFFIVRMRDGAAGADQRAIRMAGLCVVVGTGLFSMSGALFGTSPDSWAFAALLCATAALSASGAQCGTTSGAQRSGRSARVW